MGAPSVRIVVAWSGRTGLRIRGIESSPAPVTGRDVDRGIDAEPAGGLPSEHVIGDVTFEQAVAAEGTARSVVRSTRWRTVC